VEPLIKLRTTDVAEKDGTPLWLRRSKIEPRAVAWAIARRSRTLDRITSLVLISFLFSTSRFLHHLTFYFHQQLTHLIVGYWHCIAHTRLTSKPRNTARPTPIDQVSNCPIPPPAPVTYLRIPESDRVNPLSSLRDPAINLSPLLGIHLKG